MKKKLIIMFIISVAIIQTRGQEITQTIKGVVVDKETQQPLTGAAVVLKDTDPQIAAISGIDGTFKIEKVPVGRYDVLVSYIGYEYFVQSEVLVGSGKEVVLAIGLKEKVKQLKEVTITMKNEKDQPLNLMAVVSSRQFSVEEASRYAGGLDDPARLVSAFAGVAGSMSSNGIVIRGNAPKGLLWELEGVEISNPSHFANISAIGGGGLTALSSQMLANSDFYTGAFPAEFGNAVSGVFDLKLRKGNNEKYEHTVQLGALGTDISSEGPLKKGKRSSYLFNYRISTLTLLKPLLPENAEGISYQDLSFKLNFPTEKSGVYSFWGLAGYDKMDQKAQEDSALWEYDHQKERHNSRLGIAAAGISNKIYSGKNTYFSTSLALSGNGIWWIIDRLDDEMNYSTMQKINNLEWKYILTSCVNHKFNARHSNKSGLSATAMNYKLDISHAPFAGLPLDVIADESGRSLLMQAFTQSKYEISENVSLNAGLHAQYFLLNEKASVEPRAGLKWSVTPLHTLSLGYGNHSQLEQLQYYLIKHPAAEGESYPNKKMGFSKSHHFVASYDFLITEYFRIKLEPYMQLLYDIPVIPDSSFSMLNLETGWFIHDSLINTGKGKNIGIDFTAEHFLHNGFYWLFTASVFDSKYSGGDGIIRDTRYNRQYVLNLLAGKEWKTGKKGNNIFSVNARINMMGGARVTPVDISASLALHDVVYDEYHAFENKYDDVLLVSAGISYKRNKPKYSGVWTVQVSNLLSEKETYGYRYNYIYNRIDPYEQTIVLPSISYKIEF